MAKKNKQVIINEEELVSTVLKTVSDKKKISIVGLMWLFIIVIIFGVGIYFLPDISLWINNYLNPEPKIITKVPEKEEKPVDDTNPVVEQEYSITNDLEIVENNFKINNIRIENRIISFNIINTSNEELNLNNYNYFISFFDRNKKLVERVMFNDLRIASGGSQRAQFNLQNDNLSYISLMDLKIDDYPAYNVTKDEFGNGMLVCNMDKETIEYVMVNNKLFSINDTYSVSTLDPNYSALSSNYNLLSENYRNILGVTTSIAVEENMLNFKTSINLSNYVMGSINRKIIYNQNTDAKVIKFELEASGYICK